MTHLGNLLLCSAALIPALEDDGPVTQEELERMTAEIQGQVAELRGQPFSSPVAVAVTDRAGFLEYAKVRMAETSSEAELAGDETMAKLLGLVPPDMDLLGTMLEMLEEQVGGFYDPAENKFYLMESFTGPLARIILSHELTHALDDQLYDLDGKLAERRTNADETYAFFAVVEGSGSAVMNAWSRRFLSPKDMLASADLDLGMEALESAPPYLWKPLLSVYLRGETFLNRSTSILRSQLSTPDLEDYGRAFTNPPASSEQILHPEKYWDEDERDEPSEVTAITDGLAEGWELLYENTLGEIGLAMCTEPLKKRKGLRGQLALLGAKYTNRAAEGWDGDRFVLLGRGEARILVGNSVWDSSKDAREFARTFDGLSAHVTSGANELARAAGLPGAGFRLTPNEEQRAVGFASWFGVDLEEFEKVFSSVSFGVEHRD